MGRLISGSNPTETDAVWNPTGDDSVWVPTLQTYDWKGRPRITLWTNNRCMVYTCTIHMYITVDETDPRPLYRQVIDEIKALIARGELAEGSSLPPVRQVAADLGVNLNTIAFAYRQLQEEGLIRIRHGAGATVVSHTLAMSDREPSTAQLRTALTQLMLSGLSKDDIKTLVAQQLAGLKGRAK